MKTNKNQFARISKCTAVIILACAAAFVSCSKDDEKEKPQPNPLLGTWVREWTDRERDGKSLIYVEVTRYEQYTFDTDTTCRYENYAGTKGDFKYTVSEGYIHFKGWWMPKVPEGGRWSRDEFNWYYQIRGDSLYLNNSYMGYQKYVKKK